MNMSFKNIKSKTRIPYYEKSKTLSEQITRSSSRRGVNKIRFILRKIKNHIFETIAFNCPVNTWRVKLHKWRGVNIGEDVFIGFHCTLDHAYPEYIYIEDNVGLAGNVYILIHTNPPVHFNGILESYVAPVVIKKGAWIGINVTILPGVVIGQNAVVGAGIIVNKSVPDNTIVTQEKNKYIKYER